MNIKIMIVFMGLILVTPGLWAEEGKATEEENLILTLVLKRSYEDGGYTVVNPQTSLGYMNVDDSKEIKGRKKYIIEHLNKSGLNVNRLVDRLFERNKKPVRLSIESSPKDGFIIDFDSKFDKYFAEDGGGWEKWYEENPLAHGTTSVSLPIYEKKTGLVLVYRGIQTHWLAGTGNIILFRFKNGELKELAKVMMWIS